MDDENDPNSIVIDGVRCTILNLTCCRTWPILMGVPWGRCGDCGQKPSRK